MGIRTKFNLLMLLVAAAGVVLFSLAANPLIDAVAKEEVGQSARIMMESAAGARKYTSEQIAPLLKDRMQQQFFPQSVSAYAAKRNFDVIHAKFPDFSYREAALNPTNLEDRATDWESDLIEEFRAHPAQQEISSQRMTPIGPVLEFARPLTSKPACLECHSTAAAAPASMVAIYGDHNGFGLKPNEIIGAQIVTVPMTVSTIRAEKVRSLFLIPFACFFVLLLVAINILLEFTVVRPIERMTANAEAVSLGRADVPELTMTGKDQVSRLSLSFNRMRRSLAEAMKMMGDH